MTSAIVLALTAATLQTDAAPMPRAAGPLDAVPARVDVSHSTLGFTVRHLGITRIRGIFNEWSATIMWNEADPTRSTVAVVAKAASVDTRHERRDADLVGGDFFDAQRFPAIVLVSKRVEQAGDGYLLHADLTLRDITREVTLPFSMLGPQETARGKRLFAAGSFSIKRSDFDLARENRLARALAVVSDEVELEVDIQVVLADPGAAPFNSREKPSVGEEMAKVVEAEGVEAALRRYEALRASNPDDYNFADREVATLAYRLRGTGRGAGAGDIASFLIRQSPTAEAYVLAATLAADRGDATAARELLTKALTLDPLHTPALALAQLLRQG